jgi:long-chain acyl-CoA synthetase
MFQRANSMENDPLFPKHLEYPNVPLHEILHKTARVYPKKTAIVYDEREISYAELEMFSNQFANTLIKLGVKKGDRVAVFLPSIPQFIIAYFGALKAGAIITTISPLHREREVEFQLSDSGAKSIVTLDSLYPILAKVKEKNLPKNIILTNLDDYGSKNHSCQNISNTYSFQELVSEASQNPLNLKFDTFEDIASLQYTGGTTGVAKGAMLTHRNLLSNALAFEAWIRCTEAKEIFLTALPLFHIYGLTTSMTVPISNAAKMVLLPRFEPSKVLQAIEKHRVSVFCGVPTMYQALIANPEICKYDLTSIRVCISGASSLPPQAQKQFMQITGGLLAEGYGLTEASPVTHCSPVAKSMRTVKVGSIGLPLPDTEAKIVDLETDEKTLARGEMGELTVKGPQVMKGYWQKPQETDIVLRDGWLFTGDVAWMDEDGYFYITDRKKELIKSKDFSVYPRELEDILYEHPAVKLCAVIGIPDRFAGEVPKAFVVLKEDASVPGEDLMAFVNCKIASYKAIRELEFRKELPISSAGKVLKRMLKEK